MKETMKRTVKTALALVLTFAMLASLVLNCTMLPVFANGSATVTDDENVAVYNYCDMSDSNVQAATANDFNVYRSTNAVSLRRLSRVNFADYFKWDNGALKYTATTDDFDATYHSNVTTLIYNKGIFDDFEIEVKAEDCSCYASPAKPSIVFGIQNPTEWYNPDSGYEVTSDYDNAPAMLGKYDSSFTDGEEGVTDSKGYNRYYMKSTEDFCYSGAGCGFSFKLKVKDGKATYTMFNTEWPDNNDLGYWYNSYTFDLSNEYKPGYIGIKLVDHDVELSNLVINGVCTPVNGFLFDNFADSAQQTLLVNNTRTLRSEDALNTRQMQDAAFADYFTFDGNSFGRNVETDFDTISPTYWTKNTKLLFNTGMYEDFELSFFSWGDDNLGYSTPQIVFGQKNPYGFFSPDAGYVAKVDFSPNDGTSALSINTYSPSTDNGMQVLVKDQEGNNGFWGANCGGYFYKLAVKDGKVTYSVYNNGYQYFTVSEYDLGDSYDGGYVGLMFIDGATNICNLIFNSAQKADVKHYYSFDTEANYNALKNDFTLYQGNRVISKGYKKANWDEYISLYYESFRFKSNIENMANIYNCGGNSPEYDNNRARLVLNTAKYDDFELSVKYQEAYGEYDWARWMSPDLIFGIQDPGVASCGNYAKIMFNDTSNLIINGSQSEGVAYCGAAYKTVLTLKVKYGKASINVNQFDGGFNESYEISLPADYQAGYVGLEFVPSFLTVWDITVKGTAVPDSALNAPASAYYGTAYGSNYNGDAFASDFNVYYGGDRSYRKADFADHFTFADNFLYCNKDISVSDDTIYDNGKRTRFIYNKGDLDEFEMTFCIDAADFDTREQLGDVVLPRVIFGVDDPTVVDGAGSGYYADLRFSTGVQETEDSARAQVVFGGYDDESGDTVEVCDETFNNGHCGGKWDYTYSVRVKDGKVTYSLSKPEWDGYYYETSFDLPDDYIPGAVGIELINAPYRIRSIDIGGDVIPGSIVEPEHTAGDINGDDIVDETEYNYIKDLLLSVDGVEYQPALDINEDDTIDILDFIMVKLIIESQEA